jgi:hypothetical protein
MKETAMKQLHIYVSPDLCAKYEARAKANSRSVSAEIRLAMERDVARDSKKKAA